MGDAMDDTDPSLTYRVSDAEREAVAELLREQTSAGRLTLVEFEERLDEVYRARLVGELQHALRELPVQPPPLATPPVTSPQHSSAARARTSADDITEKELRRRYRQRLRNDLSGFAVPNFVCNLIWVMGNHGYWWPGWVLLGTGAGLLGSLAKGFDPEKERAALVAERRKLAMAEIEARHRHRLPGDALGGPDGGR
jgi:hypothetical protein